MSVDGLNLSVKSITMHRIIPQYYIGGVESLMQFRLVTLKKAFANLCAIPVDAVFKARYNKTEEKKQLSL